MESQDKKEIQRLLNDYVARFPSQAKASKSLENVSEATIINIRKNSWESVSDAMWLNVGKQVGLSNKAAWQMVETRDFQTLIHYFEDARNYSNVFAIVAPAGSGKSSTAEYYASKNQNTFHIVCAEYFNKKIFLSKILQKMGKDNSGYNVSEMMDEIVDSLMKMENPEIIIDEADKLKDEVLYFFITFCNMLKGKVGLILMATDHLEKKVTRGRRLNKRGYSEIFSRIGRKFIKLPGTNKKEVEEICKANGILDPATISEIFNEYELDLRRVERGVHKMKVLNQSKIAA